MSARASSFAFLTRRRVFALGLASAGAVVLGGIGLSRLRGPVAPVAGLRVLDAYEFATLDALANTLFPAGGPFPEGADKAKLARAFDSFLADEPAENITKLRRALTLFEYGPLLYERRLTTFSALSPDERLRHFESWSTSVELVRRQVSLAFRKFFSLVFYDRPEVWPFIHYPGPSLARLGR